MGQSASQNEVNVSKNIEEKISGLVSKPDHTGEGKLEPKKTREEIVQGASQHEVAKPKRIEEEINKQVPKTSMTREVKKLEPKLPYNYENIIKDADSPCKFSSMEELYSQLHRGIFLNQKTKKYWIEKQSGMNCFMLYARDLSITWGEENRYWQWFSLNETSDEGGDVAQLLNVCWLEIHGKLNTSKLSPKTVYEVLFVVKLKDPAYGWEIPVNIRLSLPNGEKKEHKEVLLTKQREQWNEISVGEFYTSEDNIGEVQFSLFEYEGGNWKKGLVVKGAVIRPKKLG